MDQIEKTKARITVSAMYSNGICLCEGQEYIADSRLLKTPVDEFRVLELRFAVPTRQAEDLYRAVSKGDVELLIQDIPPRI